MQNQKFVLIMAVRTVVNHLNIHAHYTSNYHSLKLKAAIPCVEYQEIRSTSLRYRQGGKVNEVIPAK